MWILYCLLHHIDKNVGVVSLVYPAPTQKLLNRLSSNFAFACMWKTHDVNAYTSFRSENLNLVSSRGC